ncbi:MAG: hypothetical protein KGQ66_09790 [Acidobacteriota bacterium]|nr:hypothetical protein [Acidobacteriota bacterium]
MRFVNNRGTQHGNQACPEPRTISQGRYALEPGEYAVMLLDTESTVGALAASNDVTMSGEIIVTDQHEAGIIDNTVVQVQVHAFDAAPGVTAVYQLRAMPARVVGRPSPVTEASVGLTRRRYRGLG